MRRLAVVTAWLAALFLVPAFLGAEEAVLRGNAIRPPGGVSRWSNTVVFHLIPREIVLRARPGTAEVHRGGRVIRSGGEELPVVAQAEVSAEEMEPLVPSDFIATPQGLFRMVGRLTVPIDETPVDTLNLPEIQTALLAGNFYGREDWKAVPMQKQEDGTWTLRAVGVEDGMHRFKFVVNGAWEAGEDRTFRTDLVIAQDPLHVWGSVRPAGELYVYEPSTALDRLEAAHDEAAAMNNARKKPGPEAFDRYDGILQRMRANSELLAQDLYEAIAAGNLAPLGDVLDRTRLEPEVFRTALQHVKEKLTFDIATGGSGPENATRVDALRRIEENLR